MKKICKVCVVLKHGINFEGDMARITLVALALVLFTQSARAELFQLFGCKVTSVKLTELLAGQPKFYNENGYNLKKNDFIVVLVDFSEEDLSIGATIHREKEAKKFPYSELKTKFEPRNETTKQHLPGVFFTRDLKLISSDQIYLSETKFHLNLARYSKRLGNWHGHITELQREMIYTVTLDCEIQNNGAGLTRMLSILSSENF